MGRDEHGYGSGRPRRWHDPVDGKAEIANRTSVPLIRVFWPIGALYANDAETLARRRAHDYPTLLAFVHRGTQFF
jgi:hypothetical protein